MWFVVIVLGVLSLAAVVSVGLFILPLAIAGAILLLARPRRAIGAAVLLGAVGAGPLILAYFNRPGPGHVCRTDSEGVACGDYLNPWPWLALGLALWVAAAIVLVVAARRSSNAAYATR